MKSKKLSRRLIAFFVVLAVTAMFSLQAFASVWTFSAGTQHNFPFGPRGYSVSDGQDDYWLDTDDYDHDGAMSNKQYSVVYSYGAQESTEVSELDADTYTFKAWFDKNPQGSVFPNAISKTYKDFLVVSIDGGAFVSLNSLSSPYTVTINNATRSTSVSDPDGHTNQWYVQFTMNLIAGKTYRFAFQEGLEAHNGHTLVLCPGQTTLGLNGYIGYVTSSDTNHYSVYQNNWSSLYQYPVIGNALGTDSNNNTIIDVTLYDFYHTVSAI